MGQSHAKAQPSTKRSSRKTLLKLVKELSKLPVLTAFDRLLADMANPESIRHHNAHIVADEWMGSYRAVLRTVYKSAKNDSLGKYSTRLALAQTIVEVNDAMCKLQKAKYPITFLDFERLLVKALDNITV